MDAMPPSTLFCFGLGYVAEAVAERLLACGWTVRGTSRDPEKRRRLEARGVEMHAFDRLTPVAAAALDGVTHVLCSIRPDAHGDPVLERHAEDLQALLAVQWVGYLGSTSVYGDHAGGWVDETTVLRPTSPRGVRRVRAEEAWRVTGLPVHYFRLAGIYGPGRNAFVRIRLGTALRAVQPGQVFSRIHVDDIVQVVLASMATPDPGGVYNVADDEPATADAVVAHAAALLGVDAPVRTGDASDSGTFQLRFSADSRRVANRRIRETLGVELAYPTYREGLAALLETDGR